MVDIPIPLKFQQKEYQQGYRALHLQQQDRIHIHKLHKHINLFQKCYALQLLRNDLLKHHKVGKANLQVMIQSVDNECYGKNLQASFKQSFIREEKNRGEKKNNNNKEKEIIAVAAVDKLPRFSELSETIPRWEQCINEAFITQSWLEAVGMMSGLKELFLNNLSFIRDLFKKHVVAQGNTGGITSVSEAEAYFANYIRRERPTRLFLEEKLKERSRMQNESTSLSPYETYNPLTGERSYCGVPLPADAPPRPNGRATWDNLKQSWI